MSIANGRNRPKAVVARLTAYRSFHSMNSTQSAREITDGLDLPIEYIEFLASRNGGVCRQDRSIRLSDGTEVLCDCLFGVDLQPDIDFQFWQRELADDLPKDCVAIGNDPGGAFFLLLKEGGRWRVMYYDHAYSLPSSNDEGNTYECNIGLQDLLAFVAEDFRPKT